MNLDAIVGTLIGMFLGVMLLKGLANFISWICEVIYG